MVEQRHNEPGRRGRRSADRPPRRRRQPAAKAAGRTTRRRTARPKRARRSAPEPIVVIPSDRWRPMRRVAGVPWEEQHHGEPRRVRVESAGPTEGQPVEEKADLVEFEEDAAAAPNGPSTESWELVDEER